MKEKRKRKREEHERKREREVERRRDEKLRKERESERERPAADWVREKAAVPGHGAVIYVDRLRARPRRFVLYVG